MVEVVYRGKITTVHIGLVKDVTDCSVLFDVEGDELSIQVDVETINTIRTLEEESELIVLPLDLVSGKILFDAEPIEGVDLLY